MSFYYSNTICKFVKSVIMFVLFLVMAVFPSNVNAAGETVAPTSLG